MKSLISISPGFKWMKSYYQEDSMGLGPKKKIFNFEKATINIDTCAPEPAEAPKNPPEASIRKADGGYIVTKYGGGMDWMTQPVVCEKLEKAMDEAKSHLNA